MILIGIGGNLSSRVGTPLETCEAAISALEESGCQIAQRSRWYETAPVPVSSDPWYVNGVVEIRTGLGAKDLLGLLHEIEGRFQRVRMLPNGSRTLDMDLLAYGSEINGWPETPPILPHPRLHERAFVLVPLADFAPHWRHPKSGISAEMLLQNLPSGQDIRPLRTV